jgi:hypothetical protein
MNKFLKIVTLLFVLVFSANLTSSKENFFDEALKMYQDKKYDEARFMLERNIVFNPKDEAILMLMKIALEKSNYSKVKDLSETFIKVCEKLCDENDEIQKSLKNIEPENES